jgi:hypothetical protein
MPPRNPEVPGFISTGDLVAIGKRRFGIDVPNCEMTDLEIRKVVRFIGRMIPQCRCECPRPYCHSIDLLLMLIVTSCEFPKYFSKYGLFEEN